MSSSPVLQRPAGSPWSTTSQTGTGGNSSTKVSLKHVMLQEHQEKEEKKGREEELAVYGMLFDRAATTSTTTSTPTKDDDMEHSSQLINEEDELDYAIALQLQEEENAREEALLLAKGRMLQPQGRVMIVARGVPVVTEHLTNDDDDSGEEEDDNINEVRENDNNEYRQAGPMAKHDAIINGHRNARRLELSGHCSSLGDTLIPNSTFNSFSRQIRTIDRAAHAGVIETDQTRGKGLDNKTRLRLVRIVDSGLLSEIGGIVATGKEATIFWGMGPTIPPETAVGVEPFVSPKEEIAELAAAPSHHHQQREHVGQDREFALKVYRTTLASFKNRFEYIEGDFRFKDLGQISKAKSEKIVSVWAEKELKNLTRLWRAGLPCPEPVRLAGTVLVMSFIGTDNRAAPRLGEVELTSPASAGALNDLFAQALCILRAFYDTCKLVHADFSEYNILVHHRRCVVIDVGQTVEKNHPRAMDFLERDVRNILSFFQSKRLGCNADSNTVSMVVGWIVHGVIMHHHQLSAIQQEWVDAFATELEPWQDREFCIALSTLVV